jgi:hypothetical protein
MPTAPADRVDAELRYAWAAPLIRDAALWVDLGCGDGVAAGAAGLGSTRTILADRSADALASARREVGTAVVGTVEADLGTAEGVASVRTALAGDGVVITCFDLLAELEDFTALVGWLAEVDATVLLSVPDASGATSWSASAAEELRRLLPAGTLVARQVPVRASAIVHAGLGSAPLGPVDVAAEQSAAHHLLAFGPDAARLAPASAARAVDAAAEETRAHQRDADVAYLEARLAQLEA